MPSLLSGHSSNNIGTRGTVCEGNKAKRLKQSCRFIGCKSCVCEDGFKRKLRLCNNHLNLVTLEDKTDHDNVDSDTVKDQIDLSQLNNQQSDPKSVTGDGICNDLAIVNPQTKNNSDGDVIVIKPDEKIVSTKKTAVSSVANKIDPSFHTGTKDGKKVSDDLGVLYPKVKDFKQIFLQELRNVIQDLPFEIDINNINKCEQKRKALLHDVRIGFSELEIARSEKSWFNDNMVFMLCHW